jgi:hypothetical protein
MLGGARRTGILTGAAVVKLKGAGNAVWCDGGPDFIFNRLEISGPDDRTSGSMILSARHRGQVTVHRVLPGYRPG